MTEPQPYPLSVDGLTACLTALGDTPNKIAQRLFTLGYRGLPGSSYRCPSAAYVLDVYRWAVPVVSVDRAAVEVKSLLVAAQGGDWCVRVETPQALATMIDRFDIGTAYTELHDDACPPEDSRPGGAEAVSAAGLGAPAIVPEPAG